jgi:Tfp pilus assembly protein PilO
MAMKTGLEGRPWYFGLAVGLLVLGVLGYLGYTLQIQVMQETRERQVRDIEKLQGEIARAEAAQARLPQFRREVALLEVELQKLLVILPPRRDVPTLLRRFRTLAEQGDFALNTFAPSSEVEKDFYNEWPISVELQGTYHNLAEFFDRVSRFSRIFNVDSLRIRQRPQAQHSITANFVAKTFVYKELVEAEAEGDDR